MQLALLTTRRSRRCVSRSGSQQASSLIPTKRQAAARALSLTTKTAIAHQEIERHPNPRRATTRRQWRDAPRLPSLSAGQQSHLLLPSGARAGEGQHFLPSERSRSAYLYVYLRALPEKVRPGVILEQYSSDMFSFRSAYSSNCDYGLFSIRSARCNPAPLPLRSCPPAM